jgi:RimJ/RimL family protein N-acetyltransferase
MQHILTTERLLLRQFTIDDTAFIIELVNSPGWLQFIGDRNITNQEQAKNYLENGPIKSYKDNGFGLSMVALKEDGNSIGMCGILKRDEMEYPEIGFAFLPQFMKKGYAVEIAKATLADAISKLMIPIILAITVPNNKDSIKLLEKIGLRFSKIIHSPNDNTELLLYST